MDAQQWFDGFPAPVLAPPAPRRRAPREPWIYRQTLFPFAVGLRYPGPIGPLPYRPGAWSRRRSLPVIARRGTIDPRSSEELDRLSAPLAPHVDRPRTRADCENGPRPCPFVSCRHNLFLDVSPAGSIKLNFPGLDVDEIGETCSLDVADKGGLSLREVAAEMRVTFQRAKQIESAAVRHAVAAAKGAGLDE